MSKIGESLITERLKKSFTIKDPAIRLFIEKKMKRGERAICQFLLLYHDYLVYTLRYCRPQNGLSVEFVVTEF